MTGSSGSHFRVPISILGPLWMILASLGGLYVKNESDKREAAIEAVALRKDVANMSRNVAKLEKQFTLTYSMSDANKDAEIRNLQFKALEQRVTNLEKKK